MQSFTTNKIQVLFCELMCACLEVIKNKYKNNQNDTLQNNQCGNKWVHFYLVYKTFGDQLQKNDKCVVSEWIETWWWWVVVVLVMICIVCNMYI